MSIQMRELRNPNNGNLPLRVTKGHFATSHSHINYYVDLTMTKYCLPEAREAAVHLANRFKSTTIVDTILCLDGTEVIGACVANELTKNDYLNINAHQTIYVISPEFIGGGQMIFRDNLIPMLTNKHVLVTAASVTTGKSALAAIDAITYYGGIVVGVSAIFATVEECDGHPVHSIFNPNDLGDYRSYKPHLCPNCQRGEKIEALVNSYGYSAL